MSNLPIDHVRRTAAKALSKGALVVHHGLVQWHVAGRCQAPVYRHLVGRTQRKLCATRHGASSLALSHSKAGDTLMLELICRCRSCPSCLRYRRDLWSGRAVVEVMASKRTWFGTLTLRPEEQYRALCEARRDDPSFDELDQNEQFKRRHAVISKWITLYLKRIRRYSGASLRFLLVAEAHKSGLPHYHILVHEVTEVTVTQRQLAKQWTHGFTKFKLVNDTVATKYVTKYLAKDAIARVRASIRYGSIEGVIKGDTSPLTNSSQKNSTFSNVVPETDHVGEGPNPVMLTGREYDPPNNSNSGVWGTEHVVGSRERLPGTRLATAGAFVRTARGRLSKSAGAVQTGELEHARPSTGQRQPQAVWRRWASRRAARTASAAVRKEAAVE